MVLFTTNTQVQNSKNKLFVLHILWLKEVFKVAVATLKKLLKVI